MSSGKNIIKQGAEAILYIVDFDGKKCLVKERFQKKYRLPELDTQLTKERIRAEHKAILKCMELKVPVPRVYKIDVIERKLYLEYFDKSISVRVYINEMLPKMDSRTAQDKLALLSRRVAENIAKMHKNHIIHGDLTTSNMLLNPTAEGFYKYNLITIDFGLAQFSSNLEHKAVDLYVLERAILSTHSRVPQFFEMILEDYKKTYNDKEADNVINKLEEVRRRGRKRTMVG